MLLHLDMSWFEGQVVDQSSRSREETVLLK